MKPIAAGAVLFGAAMGGLMYVNSNSSQSSWMVAGVVYVLALFLVQLLQPMTTWKQSVRFNTVIAFVVTALVFIDTLVLHQGIFKDINRSGRVPHSFALFANEWEESWSLDPVVPVTSELSSVSLLCPRDPGTVSLLWRRRLTLHHLQLLSPPAAAEHPCPPQTVRHHSGRDAQPLSFRGARIRGHARTHSPSDHGTRDRRSLGGHEGSQAGFCAKAEPAAPAKVRSPAGTLEPASAARMAETVS
jgi:hypothetical protein